MSLKRTLATVATAALLTFSGPVTAVLAQDATPGAGEDPVLQLRNTPDNYDKSDWPDKLVCGLFGGDDAEDTLSNNQPLADYISEWIGIPVEFTTGSSYNAVIEAARAGRVDCYTVGPFAYILGVDEADAEALAINVSTRAEGDDRVYDASIQPTYYSVISTWVGSGVTTIEDLPGHSFSFVDPASTSGHLIPEASMINAGVDPNDPNNNIEVTYAGSHPTSALAVANKRVDAGASTETTVANLAAEGQADVCYWEDGQTNKERTQEDLTALYESCPEGYMVPIFYSDPIPSTPFAVNKNLPPSLKQAIKDSLLATPQNEEFIKETGRWFLDPTITDPSLGMDHLDEMYNPLREVAKLLDLDLKSLEN